MAKTLGEYTKRDLHRLSSVTLTTGDQQLLDYIKDYLGVSINEAVRTAIRTCAHQFSLIEKKPVGRPRRHDA